ncbi:FAD-dependent oxidoreductase, partial [Arthrobacter sp.]|uniref:FAD-dependent oxidoreductase n=1 Tax=Arthrobacter sp. TaxID=1667 RepID=UPI0033920FE7
MAENPIVIAGAGLTGATAAEALRQDGYTGEIVLAGAEDRHPYIRPPLSKDFLAGREDAQAALVQPPGWYAEHGVRLLRGTMVESFDPGARTVTFSNAITLKYSQLRLATGASP